jgi:hypothetical protein
MPFLHGEACAVLTLRMVRDLLFSLGGQEPGGVEFLCQVELTCADLFIL